MISLACGTILSDRHMHDAESMSQKVTLVCIILSVELYGDKYLIKTKEDILL